MRGQARPVVQVLLARLDDPAVLAEEFEADRPEQGRPRVGDAEHRLRRGTGRYLGLFGVGVRTP
ncbi:hypothetical protein [Nocardiopsis sp. CNT312]|uniref:hypothetical protein n=1 Tax=Nocardiopsis sp. CNT312 TaxID=1137268 RepID=UPI00048D77CC|nr:hypothetical protein [Nocardiopsis sp. CNT312]